MRRGRELQVNEAEIRLFGNFESISKSSYIQEYLLEIEGVEFTLFIPSKKSQTDKSLEGATLILSYTEVDRFKKILESILKKMRRVDPDLLKKYEDTGIKILIIDDSEDLEQVRAKLAGTYMILSINDINSPNVPAHELAHLYNFNCDSEILDEAWAITMSGRWIDDQHQDTDPWKYNNAKKYLDVVENNERYSDLRFYLMCGNSAYLKFREQNPEVEFPLNQYEYALMIERYLADFLKDQLPTNIDLPAIRHYVADCFTYVYAAQLAVQLQESFPNDWSNILKRMVMEKTEEGDVAKASKYFTRHYQKTSKSFGVGFTQYRSINANVTLLCKLNTAIGNRPKIAMKLLQATAYRVLGYEKSNPDELISLSNLENDEKN